MKETTIKIEGMHCMGCVLGLEEKLEELDFITNAEGDLVSGTMKLTYQNELNREKIEKVVQDLGFKLV